MNNQPLKNNATVAEAAQWLSSFVKSDFESRQLFDVDDDPGSVFLPVNYRRAYQCFESIQKLADEHRLEDVLALSRVLISIVMRSIWVVNTDDLDERESRFMLIKLDHQESIVKQERQLSKLKGPLDGDYEDRKDELDEAIAKKGEIEQWLKEHGVTRKPPTEAAMADDLGFTRVYDILYRHASRAVHHSLFFLRKRYAETNQPAGHEDDLLSFSYCDPKQTERVLAMSIGIYYQFVKRAGNRLRFGFEDELTKQIEPWIVTHAYSDHDDA